jgi:SPP1 gp7 family putative phage head morphogenesis protein
VPRASVALATEIRARRLLTGKRPKLKKRLPRQQEPVGVQRDYFAAIRAILRAARDRLLAQLQDKLPGIVQRAGLRRDGPRELAGDAIAGSDYAAEINELVETVAGEHLAAFPNERLRQMAESYGTKLSTFQREQLSKQLRSGLGIDLYRAEPWLQDAIGQFASENVSLIKTVPRQFFDQIERGLVQGIRDGQTYEDLTRELEERYGVAESRARLIARDQIGKLYGNVNEARQRDLGVVAYFWRTAQDERVREEHAARDGTRFEWAEPPDDGNPGEPIQCRCWADPDLSDVIEGADAEE